MVRVRNLAGALALTTLALVGLTAGVVAADPDAPHEHAAGDRIAAHCADAPSPERCAHHAHARLAQDAPHRHVSERCTDAAPCSDHRHATDRPVRD